MIKKVSAGDSGELIGNPCIHFPSCSKPFCVDYCLYSLDRNVSECVDKGHTFVPEDILKVEKALVLKEIPLHLVQNHFTLTITATKH